MRNLFNEQLDRLNREMIRMGGMCESIIAFSAKALASGDSEAAKTAASMDAEIDQMERKIEGMCLQLLLQQQPVAKDFRQVSAALKMITDLERIGDQAADIAEIVGFLGKKAHKDCVLIRKMAEAAIRMVSESIEAYVKRDVDLADKTISSDDVVDDYFDQTKAALIRMVAENPEEGEYALDLLMIAKYLERIGDHATNVAEWVVFSVTGEHPEESRK